MEQHAVPQPITSYEFRLVGNMTIRQFGKLASGVILALIVYWINPAPGILKWFLIIFFSGLGAGMAFLPFQGRPLDTWIISFFKRIYSPTQYLWRMGGQLVTKPIDAVIETGSTANSWQAPTSQPSTPVQPSPFKPDIVQQNHNTVNMNVLVSTAPKNSSTPKINLESIEQWHEGKPEQPDLVVLDQQAPQLATNVILTPTTPSTTPPTSPTPPSPDKASVGKTTIYSADVQQSTINNQQSTINAHPTVPPAFNPSLIIPTLPKLPNILGGFVKDSSGKLVEGAIIEVRDTNLNPVRAFKTNKLGQFQIATALPNGIYEIETEKDGLTFDIIKIELKGDLIPPFEIVAKANT